MNIKEDPNILYRTYITELGKINSIQTVAILNDYSAYYMFTRDTTFKILDIDNLFCKIVLINKSLDLNSFVKIGLEYKYLVFTFNNHYSLNKFQGIILDSKAVEISLASKL